MNENSVAAVDIKSLNSLINELDKTDVQRQKLASIYNELETVVSERKLVKTPMNINNKKPSNKIHTLPKTTSSSSKFPSKSSSSFSFVQKSSLRLSEGCSKTTILSRKSLYTSNDHLERAVRCRIEDFHAIRTRLRKMNTCPEEKAFFAALEKETSSNIR